MTPVPVAQAVAGLSRDPLPTQVTSLQALLDREGFAAKLQIWATATGAGFVDFSVGHVNDDPIGSTIKRGLISMSCRELGN